MKIITLSKNNCLVFTVAVSFLSRFFNIKRICELAATIIYAKTNQGFDL